MEQDLFTRSSLRQLGSPLAKYQPSENGRDDLYSPTMNASLFDGIKDHTVLQSAILRERVFLEGKSVTSSAHLKSGNEQPLPAGKRLPACSNTIWGTIRVANEYDTNVSKGL